MLAAFFSIAGFIKPPTLGPIPLQEAAGRLFVFGLCSMGVGAGLSVRWPAYGFMVFGAGIAVLGLPTLIEAKMDAATVRILTLILAPGTGYPWLGVRELGGRRGPAILDS